MPRLVDRRGDRPDVFRPADFRPGKTRVEVVRHRGELHLRPIGPVAAEEGVAHTLPGNGQRRARLTGMTLLAGTMVATLAGSAVFETASWALPEGSLTAPLSNAVQALAREQDRRRAALTDYDHLITSAAADPALQAAWRDLRRDEAETVARLGKHLETIRRRPSATAKGGP